MDRLNDLRERLQAAEKHLENLWAALSRRQQGELYMKGLDLDPVIGPLREALTALSVPAPSVEGEQKTIIRDEDYPLGERVGG